MDMYSFLADRDVSELAVKRMKEEKIDENVIKLMDDATLSNYIPKYGDRIALFHFCKNTDGFNRNKRKMGILEKLRKKLRSKSPKKEKIIVEDDNDDKDGNARKKQRQIEVGWINKIGARIKQVRTKQGGGTRKINIDKDAKKMDILKKAQDLFFPDGNSTKGHTSDFIHDVWDFKQNTLMEDITVGKMYDVTGLPSLRFYLYTDRKNCPDNQNDQSDVVATGVSPPANSSLSSNADIEQLNNIISSPDIIRMAAAYAEIDDDDSEIEVQFGPFQDAQDLNATLPLLTSRPIELSIQSLRVHRGQVLTDMINHFSNPLLDISFVQISIEMVLPNGVAEVAEDNGGVLRDCLCEFWNDFYQQCTIGGNSKLPCLRHDYDYNKWYSVGKIIAMGWKQEGYIPVALSKPFMENCLFGKTLSNLTEGFMNVISTTDKEVLQLALTDFDSVTTEELFDVLENFSCKKQPTKENMAVIIEQLAEKAIVTEPKFIINSWEEALKNINISESKLDEIYGNLLPTPRSLIKILQFPEEMNIQENTVSKHLQRFIKDLEPKMLGKFLRFVTGSDLMVKDKIAIRFVDLQGIGRRPIAHTCGCVLEIPKQYDNYPDFKTEFLSVLESSVWVMDII